MKILYILCLLIGFLSSCGKSRENSIEKITEVEKLLEKERDINKKAALVYNLDLVYNDFVKRFPDDSMSSEFLYRSFNNNLKFNWFDRAVAIADEFMIHFPNHRKTADILFYKAYLYDEKINDDKKAGETYRLFIKKYPRHPLISDAENSLKYLGLSPEETLKKIEETMLKNNGQDSTQSGNP